ncbi:2-aminoethylphosphonate aminotransferase [Schaalia sp. lx-100]|uniref:2-aminoethylphosphonate aminotransferase n=1 Tax=Schaalia sp. lx-100 TaxID=2899081 RepID=UPI001E656343|nr:2-aminoethylphosphonate aminotransferase [Schaalia sp. lx-100]MCD4557764.1 2-aminoethylphosphonate aminotransferase [Schaalia sp. lx-100]
MSSTVQRNILLNPGPSTTTDSVKYAQIVPDICPREKEFASLMAPLREDLVRVVHGKPEEYTAVLFCGSGTICIDVVLNSLLDEGKKALVVNNGSYSQRACDVLTAYGLPFVEVKQPIDDVPDLHVIEKALKDTPDVGYVYMTFHETGSGLLNPVREVGALAHKYGAFFITDSTSAYALMPINLYEDNIDFCMASAQKGIQGMSGLSYVIGRRDIIEASKNFPVRSYYCNLYMQYEFFEKTGEMHFTPPVQTIYAARQALDEYFEEGEQGKWQRHQRVMAAIRAGIDRLGLKEMLDRRVQSGLVAAVIYPDDPAWDFEKIHDYCYERGFTIYPGKIDNKGTFRLCALGAIDAEDINNFWEVFEQALIATGVAVPVTYTN